MESSPHSSLMIAMSFAQSLNFFSLIRRKRRAISGPVRGCAFRYALTKGNPSPVAQCKTTISNGRMLRLMMAPGVRDSDVRCCEKNPREEVTARVRAGDADARQGKGPFHVAAAPRTVGCVSTLNRNRQKFLARLGRKYTAQALCRMGPERCYPIRLGFLSLVALTCP